MKAGKEGVKGWREGGKKGESRKVWGSCGLGVCEAFVNI